MNSTHDAPEHSRARERLDENLLSLAEQPGPDPFLAERLQQAIHAHRAEPGSSTPATASRTWVVAATLLVSGLLVWQAWEAAPAQDPKLAELVKQLSAASTRTEAALRLHRAGARAVPDLLAGLAVADPEAASCVQTLLAARGSEVVPPLRALLRGKDPVRRDRALATLGRMGPAGAAAIPDIYPLLTTKQAHEGMLVALADLACFGPDQDAMIPARDAVFDAIYRGEGPLGSPQPHYKVSRFVHRADRAGRKPDPELLSSEDPFDREAAADRLRRKPQSAALPALSRALADPVPRGSRFNLQHTDKSRVGAGAGGNSEAQVRLAIARALLAHHARGQISARAQLILLAQGDVLERHAAVESLGRIGSALDERGEITQALSPLLSGADLRLACAASTSLGMLGKAGQPALPDLRKAASRGDKELAARAQAAIRQIERAR